MSGKITTEDSTDNSEILKNVCFPSNQRPEQCPRSKLPAGGGSGMYRFAPPAGAAVLPPLSILTVGDGDFSFSLSLANQLLGEDAPTGAKLTATSHESLKSVLRTYQPHASDTLAQLQSLGATVLHDVDATALSNTMELRKSSAKPDKKRKHEEATDESATSSSKIKMKRFDVVIWNFPCISLPAGADGQAKELRANQDLLAKFFINVRACLTKGTGEVHISHKTIEPFSWWGIKEIAAENGFEFAYAVVFDRCIYPGYTNRKALDRKSFPCNDAQTYVFVPSAKNSASAVDDGNTSTTASAAADGKTDAAAVEDASNGADTLTTAAAQRTPLPYFLKHGVLVSMRDRRIARKIWNYLKTQYPVTST